ncbi:hypothetical protein [Pseudomonas sp. AL03]|uniref:hypothetical protein n=1 Tax=Pseudomonas sp. AL03 TaxID=3042230 RepID=UPI00249C735A|nr:hypothetical protein [Pseudomonas sp. AL03]MDI3274018.1 hypothetical protein [Pseudomonas sp. AL03]
MHNETLRPILGALQIQKLRFVRKTHDYRVVEGAKISHSAVFKQSQTSEFAAGITLVAGR